MHIKKLIDRFFLTNNKYIGSKPKLHNSKIKMNGNNNVIYFGTNVSINNCQIRFNGNNSLIFLCTGVYNNIDIDIHNNSTLYIGHNNYFNPYGNKTTIILSEGKNLFIGDKNLFSYGICIRNADPHLLYDVQTLSRINYSKSIYIGDHVWIGQNSTLLKGTHIGSGSILGACSLIAGKKVSSNSVYGGNPAKKIKDNTCWDGKCVHKWTKKETQKYKNITDESFIYENDGNLLLFDDIENHLENCQSAYDKYNYLKTIKTNKNRFYIY